MKSGGARHIVIVSLVWLFGPIDSEREAWEDAHACRRANTHI